MSATEHYNLQKAGAAGVLNKWALYDGNFDRIEAGRTMKALAAAALAAGDLVYRNASGQLAKATNADRPLVGFVQAGAGAGTDAFAQTEGVFTKTGWSWTAGALLYAHPSTPGALTQTPTDGLFQPPVAVALDADTIWIFPAGLQAVPARRLSIAVILPGSPSGAGASYRMVVPVKGTIKAVRSTCRVAPSSNYTFDLNKNGVTLYTTQANRPVRTAAQGTGLVTHTLPDVTSLAAGDVLDADVDTAGTGIEDVAFFIEYDEGA
jgi:hypothetical protein